MQQIKIKIKEPLVQAQLFFVQKSIELLDNQTIDTYRLRINNPRTILREVVQVITNINNNSLKTEYANVLFKETLDILKQENELDFFTVRKEFFLKALADKDIKTVYYICNILIKNNVDYGKVLYKKIHEEIKRLKDLNIFNYEEYDTLNKLIGYLFIDLRDKGYSKNYLHKFIRAIFSPRDQAENFDQVYEIIQSLITRKKEEFTIYVGFKSNPVTQKLKINHSAIQPISFESLKNKAEQINSKFLSFIEDHPNSDFYEIKVNCYDYLTAGYVVRQELQRILDLLHMGYNSEEILAERYCFIVGTKEPGKANRQKLDYQLDGHFLSNPKNYQHFFKNLDRFTKKPIDELSLSKFFSGLRYFRLGGISEELEGKLLNYWIAIEYLFSSADASSDKTKRLNEYFKNIHSLSYATRLFQNTHKAIIKLKLHTQLPNFENNNIKCLTDPLIIEQIEALKRYPLLAYRLFTINKRFESVDNIKSELFRHQNNIEWNLIRMYRVRNEIVHSAAKDINIVDMTSHLRYYLTFIINGFIQFLLKNPPTSESQNKFSIDDYFFISNIQLKSLMTDKELSINSLFNFKDPVAYLS